MKSKNVIRWLHLSDLHIGNPDSLWVDSTLRSRLTNLLETIGEVQFILITGDVIHQGKYRDKDINQEAARLINELKEFCPNIVFAIGNHDYCRDNIRFNMLSEWEKMEPGDKLKNQDKCGRKLRSDFEDYVQFCKENTQSDNPITTKSYIYNRVEGINIIVLNTSIFAGQPLLNKNGEMQKKDGNVLVDDNGKIRICESDFPEVAELDEKSPTIVVGHHTIQMMDEYSQKKVIEFIKGLPSKYYFCGHIHASENQIVKGITQLASAGLFRDDYNVPTVTLYQIKRNENEHIDMVNMYSFQKDEWKPIEKRDGMNDSQVTEERTETPEETVVRDEDAPILFPMIESSLSDGAVSIPYNGGAFNLYLSKPLGTEMLIPHMHKDVDEITYMIRGKAYGFIGDECKEIRAKSSVLVPKGKSHVFVPCEYPCEFITMSVKTEEEGAYKHSWIEKIELIEELNQKLNSCEEEDGGKIYDEIIKHLDDPVLEVRWKATEVLKKYCSQEEEEKHIQSKINTLVIEALKNPNTERKLFGISMACEFRTGIKSDRLRLLMTNLDHFIFAWNCAYYLISTRTNIDYDKLYNKLMEKEVLSEEQSISLYYNRIIISLLQLMIKHNSKHFDAVYSEKKESIRSGVIPIDCIVIHFVLWYTAFKFQGEEFKYKNALEKMKQIQGIDEEKVLRGLLSFSSTEERFKVLKECKEKGVLDDVIKAYFGSFQTKQKENNNSLTNTTKDHIKNYLRIIVSQNCNLNCVYCHHEGRTDGLLGDVVCENKDFDLDSLLLLAKQKRFTKIKLSGGEPLLYPNILNICSKFQNDFEDIGFTTNGTQILRLKPELEKLKGCKLSFNVTLNTLNEERYKAITGGECLEEVKEGIEYLVKNGFQVKLNSVITGYNVDDMESLIAYAARHEIDIKFLDLFSVGKIPDQFQHVSIAEIKSRLKELYNASDEMFYMQKDYMCMDKMGIKIMIPKRLYSSDCIYNCEMYPCAEGIFGMRVYEDYTCARCFNGEFLDGGLDNFSENVDKIRREIDLMNFSF